MTQVPPDARRLFAQVKQVVELLAQVLHVESQFEHVVLSLGSRKDPLGQLSTHCPLLRTKPGRQLVHLAWSIVLAMVKDVIPHAVHFSGQASHSFLLLSATKPLPAVSPV